MQLGGPVAGPGAASDQLRVERLPWQADRRCPPRARSTTHRLQHADLLVDGLPETSCSVLTVERQHISGGVLTDTIACRAR